MNFPFSAIVGQEALKRALLLCAIDPTLGGVLVRGDKGAAKSTTARALPEILPAIERIAGCAYNCEPGAPCAHCERCAAGNAPVEQSSAPFVTLPLGATDDRVLGTVDLQRLLSGGGHAFQPGLLAAAHRGILYIDEVNLLADHLVDILLDAAAMGFNSVQREGISVVHPARFTLVGTMNQEEGELRPQLLDRFGLMVDVVAPRERALRADVVRRRLAFEADPAGFARGWDTQQQALREQLSTARRLLPRVTAEPAMFDLISYLCCEFEVASLRADIVMHKAARALAAMDGRTHVHADDVRAAAELALPHRRRRKPFEQPGLEQERLDELMQHASRSATSGTCEGDVPGSCASDPQEDAGDDPDEAENDANDPAIAEQVFAATPVESVRRIATEAAAGAPSGRRGAAAGTAHGVMLRAVRDDHPDRLAVAATVRSAALRDPSRLNITPVDLHQQVRSGQSGNLILFVVDASGSMAAHKRMEAVKGAVLSLLTDAYQRRDEVAVITFRAEAADLLLSPTRSVELAEQSLRMLPTGGRTPLPHALQLALQTLQRARGERTPLLVLLSDGKANVALEEGGDAWRDALDWAGLLAERAVPALVLDTESGYLRLGRAGQLAAALGAPCLTLEELSGDSVALTVRSQFGLH